MTITMALIWAWAISSKPSLFLTKKRNQIGLVILLALTPLAGVSAKGFYQKPLDFVAQVFGGTPPAPQRLVLRGALAEPVKAILGHTYPRSRIRYWRDGNKTVWVLDEIGKEKPITTGIVVADGKIVQVKILAFRESRGGEVRFPSFVRQYETASLSSANNPASQLSKNIDGITGATLSVRAVNKLARLALFLHQTVTSHAQASQ